jgi:two-component system CheB/CheR fusion protein
MQSTNEELQSTNEELETSKEELQSINEELITVNSELQAKIVQLSDMQNDMKNLFDNMRIGIIFLDSQLRIRRFTREVTQIYRLVSSDIGRYLSDIKSDLIYETLLIDAQAVMDTLVFCEREVATQTGERFQVQIQPYRTLDNVIDGVVISLSPL